VYEITSRTVNPELPPVGAALAQLVPLLVSTLPVAPGATELRAEPSELETITPLAASELAFVPPFAMGKTPVTPDVNEIDGGVLLHVVPFDVSKFPAELGRTLVAAVPSALMTSAPVPARAVAPVPPEPTFTVPKLGAADEPVKLPNALFAGASAALKLSA